MKPLLSSRQLGRLIIPVLLAAVLGGCGYSFNPLYPTDIKTVAVPMWNRGERVYRREIEMRLTEAIVKHIELETPYKVESRDKADTELTGTVERVEQRILTFNPDTGRPRELEMTIFVSFEWRDRRKGREDKPSIVKRANFSTAGTYITEEPFSRDFFQGSEDVINKLAQGIVQEMQKGW